MPHGVLFRGGDEREIRHGSARGRPARGRHRPAPNLFYGTGIPACILVLRQPGAKPTEPQGKVLFINADREYREGRAQNYLDPEHIEKIVSTYEAFADVPGFAAVVADAELQRERRQPQHPPLRRQRPPPEPHDVRAHLHGGVPKTEIECDPSLRRGARLRCRSAVRATMTATMRTSRDNGESHRYPSHSGNRCRRGGETRQDG